MGVLRLLGPDQSTVLWDFDDPTGAANPNTVVTNLGADLNLGTDEVIHRLLSRGDYGSESLGFNLEPVEAVIPFTASATTDVNLWTGLGQLGRYLLSVSTDHPLYLEWTELASNARYMDIVGVRTLPQILTGRREGSLSASRANTLGPISIVVLRQPWMRGAAVTSSSDTVEDDPATGTPDGSRVYALTVSGDLPTPGRVRVQMDTGSTVASLLVGHRARKNRASTYFSDYLSDTGWFQCEATNRNWTITLGTDTTAVAFGATASPGSGNTVAEINGSGTSATTLTRRVRATRTTAMDSLRGSWVPYVRIRNAAAVELEVQIRWGPSTADPVAFASDIYTLAPGTGGTGAFVELPLGRIDIPQTVSLAGMAIEVWTRHVTGTSAIQLDLVDLWPAEGLAAVVVPLAAPTKTNGENLTSPPDQISGDPAWTAGGGTGPFVSLTDDLDAAGLGPNTGTIYQAGRHRFTFDVEAAGTSPTVAECRVTNVTDNTEMASQNLSGMVGRRSFTLDLDADGADAYQAQVTATDLTAGSPLRVWSITHQFMSSILVNESIRTDPTRIAVDRLDASGNLAGYLDCEGPIPVILEPGDNHLKLRADEIPKSGYTENENKLDRDLTVSVTYDPRYAL